LGQWADGGCRKNGRAEGGKIERGDGGEGEKRADLSNSFYKFLRTQNYDAFRGFVKKIFNSDPEIM
jgi:hypothetical protein